jgi:hypothetical protein
MSTETNASGGSNSQSSGSGENNQSTKDTVAYDTYRKLLSEKKKRDDEVEALRVENEKLKSQEQQAQEAKLKEQQEWKKLHDLRMKEVETERQKVEEERKKRQALESEVTNGLKINRFLKAVNGHVEPQYFGLIDTSKIAVDPSTGQIDEASVQAAAREFEKTYGRVISTKSNSTGLPNDAAKGGSERLSYDSWKALKNSKEMREKFHLVDWKTK